MMVIPFCRLGFLGGIIYSLWWSIAQAAVSSDEILSLPGWNQPLPSKQYGGYLSAEGGETQLFYLFVESERDPSTDPIILWLNGGPGCSSLLGYFTEHGPFLPTSADTVELREYRWSRLANIIYLESPVGVGFTYSTTNNYYNNDTRTSMMNYDALQSFFTAYPEYKNNPFYIMGESYAGIYVPTLAYRLLKAGANFVGPPLLGVAVGNGCTGTDSKSTCAVGTYCDGADCPLSGNQLMPGACAGYSLQTQYLLTIAGPYIPTREAVDKNCNWTAVTLTSSLENGCSLSPACWTAINEWTPYFTAIDYYNVFGSCNNPNFTSVMQVSCIQQDHPIKVTQHKFRQLAKHASLAHTATMSPLSLNTAVDDDTGDTFDSAYWQSLGAPAACLSEGPAISEYANNPAFIAAVHAQTPSSCWGACNDVPSFTYYRIVNNTADIYAYLIPRIRVLIYDGDFDAVVPYNDNYGWTTTLAEQQGYPILQPWAAWQYTSVENNSTQVGGFRMKWDTSAVGTTGGFEFRTVRAAGHTVPQDTPDKAFQVLAHFLGEGGGHYYYPPSECVNGGASNNEQQLKATVMAFAILFAVSLAIATALCFFLFGRWTSRSPQQQQLQGGSYETKTSNPMQTP